MIGPLSLEGLATPRMNNRHPLDLHWRKEPPFWRGNLENAYSTTYPKFCDQVLCYQCGAIPCPYTHDDTEKKQRLTDLEFVKEMAKERREFKQEMKVLAEQVDYLERLQEEWNRTKMLLESEIRRLNALNDQNKELLNAMRKDAYKIHMLEQKCAALEDENTRLSSELGTCRRIMDDQHTEIATLLTNNKEMTHQLETSKSKVKKLVIKMDESKLQLEKAQREVKEKDDTILKLQAELRDVIEELAEKTKQFKIKEIASDKLIKELNVVIIGLKDRIATGENENKELKRIIQLLKDEIEMLKKKLASDTRFRQFVDIKREYNTLKDVSGTLAQKVQIYENEIPLPVVKKGGKTATKRSSVSGAGTRPRSAILSRPKSAKTPVRPPTADSSVANIADFEDYDDLSRPQSSASAYRSGVPSRSQSALSHQDSCHADNSLGGAGFSSRLTSFLRNTRPKSSIMRSSSVLSNPRTVRIMESPIEFTIKHQVTTSPSPDPLQSALKTRPRLNADIRYDVKQALEDEQDEREEMHDEAGFMARPPSPTEDTIHDSFPVEQIKNEQGEKKEEDDMASFSDMSFEDLDMDVAIDF